MKIRIFQVDAFTDKLFAGNPAAVCPLDSWPDASVMQNIAAENNLAETAFFVKKDDDFQIRWFTPKAEVDLCGHATLATAYVLYRFFDAKGELVFHSRSGILKVSQNESWLTLDFPCDKIEDVDMTTDLLSSFDRKPVKILKGKMDYLFIYPSQSDVERITPYFDRIRTFETRGIIISAPGKDVDLVSRYFAPAVGINEDPVTGSAHTTLMPYWYGATGKTSMTARQLSERGGYLKCMLKEDRVLISGQAVLYLEGSISC